MTIAEDKERLRTHARSRRADATRAAGADAPHGLADHLMAALPGLGVGPGAVVAAFWPLAGEMDLRPLMDRLDGAGYAVALPVVVGVAQPLLFRVWHPDMALDPGPYDTHHPPEGQAEVTPDLILAPLLAFDGQGYRLGYGGGFYDRTLAALRAAHPMDGTRNVGGVIAIGAAYAGQQVDAVPFDETDQPLDGVVTEQGLAMMGTRA